MGTTAEKLAYLEETKADIRAALVEKGLDVPENTPFREYGDLIRGISGDSLATVGDVKFTVRKDLESDWLLCDGSIVDLENYPGLDTCKTSAGEWGKLTQLEAPCSSVAYANNLFFVQVNGNEIWYAEDPRGIWTKKADTLNMYKRRFFYWKGQYCSITSSGLVYTTPDMDTQWTRQGEYIAGGDTRVCEIVKDKLFSISIDSSTGQGTLYRASSYTECEFLALYAVQTLDMLTDGEQILLFKPSWWSDTRAVIDPVATKLEVSVVQQFKVNAATKTGNYIFLLKSTGELLRCKSIADFIDNRYDVVKQSVPTSSELYGDKNSLVIGSITSENGYEILDEETLEPLGTMTGLDDGTTMAADYMIANNKYVIGVTTGTSRYAYIAKGKSIAPPHLPTQIGNGSLAYIKAK